MKSQLTLIGALTVAAASIFLLFKARSDRDRLGTELADNRAAVERLQSQVDELSKAQVSVSELARLQADQHDAIRLRGEITSLKKSLAEAESAANLKRAVKPSNSGNDTGSVLQTGPLPEDNPEVRVLKTKLIQTQIPPGHSLLVGGWESQPGKRTFALVDPKRDPNGSETISVTTRWVELSTEAADRLRLGSYLDKSGEQFATLPSFSAEDFGKTFEKEEGVDILSGPIVSTLSGRQARIAATDRHNTAAGPVDLGQQLDILPTLSETGEIEVKLRASMTLPREPRSE